eukprot:CAMPEP_0205999940 /NCGR_PEP_ID=MMETSP1464-20131121/1155_1 /ASSEMBLY_ACC=CAM_ASM_001124 /TAXON_ID=119497 /ORGANISM="Exanthemachrysis gayraliae, Strain RCC1523" /LENGTH=161 /DNA_ID=CAMNT_0053373173 /DNA_START=81 /DNA_END=567 /DNA_ORIENTATION=-
MSDNTHAKNTAQGEEQKGALASMTEKLSNMKESAKETGAKLVGKADEKTDGGVTKAGNTVSTKAEEAKNAASAKAEEAKNAASAKAEEVKAAMKDKKEEKKWRGDLTFSHSVLLALAAKPVGLAYGRRPSGAAKRPPSADSEHVNLIASLLMRYSRAGRDD